jgi:hypothetical protein
MCPLSGHRIKLPSMMMLERTKSLHRLDDVLRCEQEIAIAANPYAPISKRSKDQRPAEEIAQGSVIIIRFVGKFFVSRQCAAQLHRTGIFDAA